MKDTVYRLSDLGVLHFKGSDNMWHPVDCGDYEKYCGMGCKYFKANGNTAILGCCLPETVVELED